MSNEQVKPSVASTAAQYLAFPVITTGAGAIASIKRNHGIKNAIASCRVSDFKKLRGNLSGDCFTKGIELAENYDKYKELSKNVSKLTKKVNKGKLSIFQRFFNLFRSQENKVTFDMLEDKLKKANSSLDSAKAALASGKTVVEEVAEKGLKANAKRLFKNEVSNPLVLVMTALQAVPEITEKVIPTFKEKGFWEGLKQTGKSVLKIGSDFLSFAAGSALGRVVGSAIGTVICPGAGSAIGAKIGDMIGGMFIGTNVTKVVSKVIGEDEASQDNAVQNQQQNAENASLSPNTLKQYA